MSFKFIDLFCGIGGFHRALANLGGECVFASDIDKKCQDVYEQNFGIRPVGDICAVRSEDVPDHDVLCGGFPCQPFSNAGHRGAFEDTRGTLFQDIARIVRDKKPKILLLENVKGIKNIQGGHVYRTILGVFESLGYTMKDVVLSPDKFGVPQKRERVYFIGIRSDLGVATVPPVPVKAPCSVLDSHVDAKYTIPAELRDVFSAWDEMIPKLVGTSLGVPIILDYFTADENAPGTQSWKKTYITKNKAIYSAHKDAWDAWMSKHHELLHKRAVYRKLEWQAGKMKHGDTVLDGHFIQMRQSGIRIKQATTFPTLVAIVQTSIIGSQARHITPRECARLQSFPDTHILHSQDKFAYKQLGNSVNVNVVEHVARHALSIIKTDS
jgi:DNA (cytosine-5)-methyltransferase 1